MMGTMAVGRILWCLRIAIASFVTLLAGGSARAAEGIGAPSTNLALVYAAAREAVRQAVEASPLVGNESAIQVAMEGTGSENWLLESALVETLTERGWIVHDTEASNAGVTWKMSCRPTEIGTHYRHADMPSSDDDGGLRREITVRAHFSLERVADGEVVWMGEHTGVASTRLSSHALSIVESQSYPFTQADPPGRAWGKYAEPALVSGVVTGLLLLFFTNR